MTAVSSHRDGEEGELLGNQEPQGRDAQGQNPQNLEPQDLQGQLQIQELRHRYRNSLQVMNSIVGLHARGIKDPQSAETFGMLRKRLSIVARIFSDLDDEPGETVDLGSFLPRITHLVANLYDHDNSGELQCEIADVRMVKTRAGTLAQILAELLMAAFQKSGPGDIIGVHLAVEGERLVLTLTSAQASEQADATASGKLALTIVKALAMTLNAALDPAVGGGDCMRLRLDRG